MRRIALCGAGVLFVLACGQGAALRSAQEAGEKVQESSSLLSGSNQSQSSTGAVKEISLAELSAMNKSSNKGTTSGTGTTSVKVAKPLPQGETASGASETATRSSGAAANSSGISVPAPRTTVPGSGSSTGVSRTSARGVGPDLGVTKDITGLERVVLKGGNGKVLTQAMMNQRCRRYIIEGPFDLAGKAVAMPYGSVLDLENGELRNGTLVMDQTRVTPIYGISKETRISKVKVTGEYYETLVDLWGVHEDPVFPWDTSAPKKVYVVDLKKFGITPGYQKKGADGHYTDRQYDLMYQNGVGFTEAIQWAYKNGFDGIRFPKNDYCFTPRTVGEKNSSLCGQVLVQDLEKFDIDLGGGSYYNILDSSRKSKYYKAEGEAYQQASYMFWLAMCINVTIRNGKLIGDRKLRDYTVNKETAQESTVGIDVSAYCYNIRIRDIAFSDFMADGVSASQTGDLFLTYDSKYADPGTVYVSNALPGRFIYRGGRVVQDIKNEEKCLITNYISLLNRYSKPFDVVRKLKEAQLFSFNNNRGYTRITNAFLNADILTFNEKISKEQPIRIISSSYLDRFRLNPDETGVKIQFYYDDGVGKEGFKHGAAVSDVITSDCIVERCTFHNNHRGGISGGCNNMIIRYCTFTKNDSDTNFAGKAIPLFTIGGTNYQIDFEDSYAKNLKIHNCSFKRTKNSIGKILLGVLTFEFYNNTSDAGILIYNNIAADIHDNHFSGTGVGYMGWVLSKIVDNQTKLGCKYLTRVTYVHENKMQIESMANLPYRTLFILK